MKGEYIMYQIDSILEVMNHDNTISLNRYLVEVIGHCETAIYSALISKFVYYNSKNMLKDDGFFFSTIDDLGESTGYTDRQQRKAIKNLVSYGLIKCVLKGIPAKRYFKICDDVSVLEGLLEKGRILKEQRWGANNCNNEYNLMLPKCVSSYDKSAKLDNTKVQNYYNNPKGINPKRINLSSPESQEISETTTEPKTKSEEERMIEEEKKKIYSEITDLSGDKKTFTERVFKALSDIAKRKGLNFNGNRITSKSILDNIKEIGTTSNLYQWICNFEDEWGNILSENATKIRNKTSYFKTCLVNSLMNAIDNLSDMAIIKKNKTIQSNNSFNGFKDEFCDLEHFEEDYEIFINNFDSKPYSNTEDIEENNNNSNNDNEMNIFFSKKEEEEYSDNIKWNLWTPTSAEDEKEMIRIARGAWSKRGFIYFLKHYSLKFECNRPYFCL